MIRNRWSFICQEPRFESSVLKIICSILMLMIKKHLKSPVSNHEHGDREGIADGGRAGN